MKRIHREIADLKKEDLGPICLEPTENNLYLWKASIPGPTGSVYEGGVFDVEITLPTDYPWVVFLLILITVKLFTYFTLGSQLPKHYLKLGELETQLLI